MQMKLPFTKLIKLFKILRVPAYWRPILRGVAASVEHEKVLGLLNCSLVLDVGANRGQFALAARHAFPTSRILCFEPLPGPRQLFERVLGEDKNVACYPYAIGEKAETRIIHISARDDSSSLLPIGSGQTGVYPGTEEVGTQEIEVRPLHSFFSADELKNETVLLKIDVQGFEFEVLSGCKPVLPNIEWIFVECSFEELYEGQKLAHEVITMLDRSGFSVSGVYNSQYTENGRAIQADFLFENTGSQRVA